MKSITFSKTYINKYGREAHKPGTVHNGADGLYMYGFDRMPRKLKKRAKAFCKPINKMIWLFSKPSAYQLKDPSFMWLECFTTIL